MKILTAQLLGRHGFCLSERVLIAACEFWAAAMNRELCQYLDNSAELVLREAREAFATMEIAGVVAILDDGIGKLTRTSQPMSVKLVAASLQKSLLSLHEPVDQLIAEYAVEQTWWRLDGPNAGDL